MELTSLNDNDAFCACCGSLFFMEQKTLDGSPNYQGIMLSTNTSLEPFHPNQTKTIVETPHGPLAVFLISVKTEDDEDIHRYEDTYDDDWLGGDDSW